jgi:hypothetical protein
MSPRSRRQSRAKSRRKVGTGVGNRRFAEAAGATFYRTAIDRLQAAQIPFLVGGAYALEVLTGIVRRTKDFDIFLREEDVDRCLIVLSDAGYRTELTYPHWLGKAFCGEEFIDLIFNSGNGFCRVDQAWFQHARSGRILGLELKLCPVEEIIWQKSFILERNRCDIADVAHLLRDCGAALEWQRLLTRFGDFWRVLLAQIMLFDFVYPGHRNNVPDWVRDRLWWLYREDKSSTTTGDRSCYGTLLSASQFLRDIDLEGYRDIRLPPTGILSREQIAIWTSNFMQH